jgi:hypothetical protein
MVDPSMNVFRSLLLILVFFLSSAAYSASNEYDGQWTVTVNCGVNRVKGDPFSVERKLTVTNGSGTFEINSPNGSSTRGTVKFRGNLVSLTADGKPLAPTVVFWQWKMGGSLSSESQFQMTGDEWTNGTFSRDCTASGILVKPSPLSLAGRLPVNDPARSVNSPSPSRPVTAVNSIDASRAASTTRDHNWWAKNGDVNTAAPTVSESIRPVLLETDRRAALLDQISALGLSNQEELKSIQTALRSAGFYKGAIDGLPGPRSRTAIADWQRSEGLSPTGRLTPDQILSVTLIASVKQVISPTTIIRVDEPIAKDPEAGERANLLQTSLEQKYTSRVGPVTANKIFVGKSDDILLFTNESPLAPHFFRQVSGAGVFRGNRMNVCSLGGLGNLQPAFSRFALNALQKLKSDVSVQATSPWALQCKSLANNNRDDVLAVSRGELTSNLRLQEQVISALADKKIRLYHTIDFGPLNALIKQQEENRKIFNAQLKNGTLTGVGLLATASDNTIVCSAGEKDSELVERLVTDINLGILSDKSPGEDPVIVQSDIDDVFLRTKRGECGFVLGDGATLQLLNRAFERDGFSMELVPVFVPQDKVDSVLTQIETERATQAARSDNLQSEQARLDAQAARELQARQEAALQAEERRRTELAQQARLEEIRRANDEAARIEELERTRRLVSSRGRAIQDVLDERVRKHMNSVVKEVEDTKMRAKLGTVLTPQEMRAIAAQNELDRLGQEFPDWSNFILKRAKEEWDFGDVRANLEDYGQAKWRGRDIEAISVRVEFPMSNPVIGERTTDCEVFTWINDEEFKFWRQAFSADCASYDNVFKKWSTANQFVSQWKLSPAGTGK